MDDAVPAFPDGCRKSISISCGAPTPQTLVMGSVLLRTLMFPRKAAAWRISSKVLPSPAHGDDSSIPAGLGEHGGRASGTTAAVNEIVDVHRPQNPSRNHSVPFSELPSWHLSS
eukprot:scaffold825_cov249-Pinguiococcus_pyrenoidosus.AAC.14